MKAVQTKNRVQIAVGRSPNYHKFEYGRDYQIMDQTINQATHQSLLWTAICQGEISVKKITKEILMDEALYDDDYLHVDIQMQFGTISYSLILLLPEISRSLSANKNGLKAITNIMEHHQQTTVLSVLLDSRAQCK